MIALFPITPFVGSEMIMLGFAVSLIAGLGNVPGVVGAGLILGLVNGMSGAYGTPEWTNGLHLRADDRDPDLPAARSVRWHNGAGN